MKLKSSAYLCLPVAFLAIAILNAGLHAQPSVTKHRGVVMTREEEMAWWIDHARNMIESELIATASDPAAKDYLRAASGVLLLREHRNPTATDAALSTFGVVIPAGLDEFESCLSFEFGEPVAHECVSHPDLMPTIIERTVNGVLPEPVTGTALLAYEGKGQNPKGYLEGVMKRDLKPEQREICEQLMATLNGTRMARDKQKAQALAQPVPASKPSAPPDASSTPQPSALPWLLGGASVLLAAGSCWFLRRKAKGA